MGKIVINPSAGVLQGDPISPLLFQLLMAHLLQDIRDNHTSSLLFSFLDDNNVVCKSVKEALDIFREIKTNALKEGMEINISKCYLFAPNGWDDISPKEYPEISLITKSRRGAFVLGSFVGYDDFINQGLKGKIDDFIEERIKKFNEIVEFTTEEEEFKNIPLTQHKVELLRFCVAPVLMYSMRTAPTRTTKQVGFQADCETAACLIKAITIPSERYQPQFAQFHQDLDNRKETIREQINFNRIFCSNTGVGLMSMGEESETSYLSSMALSTPVLIAAWTRRFGTAPLDIPKMLNFEAIEIKWRKLEEKFIDLKTAARRKYGVFETEETPKHWRKQLFPICYFKPNAKFGKQIHPALTKIRRKLHSCRILDEAARRDGLKSTGELTKILSCSQKGTSARAWLHVNLKNKEKILQNQNARDEYLKQCSFHPVLVKCRWCNVTDITKPTEDHSVSCINPSLMNARCGKFIERQVIEAIAWFDVVIMRTSKIEDSLAFTSIIPDAKNNHFGDALTLHRGRETVVDVTFTSQVGTTKEHRSLTNPKFLVDDAEEGKIDKYKTHSQFEESSFCPMGVDSNGRMGKRMVQYFNECNEDLRLRRQKSAARHILKTGPTSNNGEYRQAMEDISIAVCKANGMRMLVCRSGILPDGLTNDQAKQRAIVNRRKKIEKESNQEGSNNREQIIGSRDE
jgi:hypothetical protein